MSFLDYFKIPTLPKTPTALTSYKEVDRDTFLLALEVLDVGITCGHGLLNLPENIMRVFNHEGGEIYSHVFGVYAPGADPEIYESNWPRVRRGLPASTYLGGNRHTVFARYPIDPWQKNGGISTVDTIIDIPTPYAAVQIPAYGAELLGRKPANFDGVTCTEMVTLIERGQRIPFVPARSPHLTTPTNDYQWLSSEEAKAAKWQFIGENCGDRYFLAV